MHPSIYKRPLLITLIIYIVCLVFFYKPVPAKHDISSFRQQTVTVTGQVESFTVSKPKTNNVLIRVKSVNGQKAGGFVYARFENFYPHWKDILTFTGKVKTPFGTNVKGNFNWQKYLAYKHVFAEVKTADVAISRKALWPYRIVRGIREHILAVFKDRLPAEVVPVASGILLGERSELDPSLFTAFQDSGAIHLLVASGGNVGFVTLMTLAVCGLFPISRKRALIIAVLLAGFYTLIAGADAPLVRAYFMTVCAILGYLLGRNSGVFQGLLLSCFVILIFNPASLFDTGFQMSFLATLAIVLCVCNYELPSKWPAGIRFFIQIFIVTLSTQLILLPVFTNIFYKVSFAGLFSNMLLVPFASGLLGLCFAYYMCEIFHVGFLLYFPTVWGLELFTYLVKWFASFPFSSFAVTAWQPTTIGAYFAGLFILFNLPLKAFIRKIFIPVLAVMVLLMGCSVYNNRLVRIYLLDEFSKRVVLVRYPSGQTFVFGTALAPEKIKAALYSIGAKSVTGEFLFAAKQPKKLLQDFIPVQKTVIPFTPETTENSWQFGNIEIGLRRGLVQSADGTITEQEIPVDKKHKRASYCLSSAKTGFCIGAEGAFVLQSDGTVTFAQRNKTVLLKI